MIGRIKTLGLALVAVFAMSAVVAAAASAHPVFTSTDATTTNIATEGDNHVLEVTGLAVTCGIADFKGHFTGLFVTSITLKPVYTNCTAKLRGFNVNATVTGFGHNGGNCDYVIHATGTFDLNCVSGEVTVDAGTCTMHIPPQKNLEKVTFANSGGQISATLEITGINVSHTDGFGCPFAGGGSGAIGTLGGSSIVSGTDAEGNLVSVSHDAS